MRDHTDFTSLQEIINKLKPNELRTARNYILGHNVGRESSLAFKLLEFLSKKTKKRITTKTAQSAIGVGSWNEATFNRLASRLKRKVLHSLIDDINVQSKASDYAAASKALFDTRKEILIGLVLRTKGLTDIARSQFNRVLIRAQEFELYNEVLEVLYIKRKSFMYNGEDSVEKLDADIEYYERCRSAVIKAENWYTKYFKITNREGLNNEKVGLLTEAVAELQGEYKATASANVGYFLYTLMAEYYLAHEDYNLACHVSGKLIGLIENNPPINLKNRMGGAQLNLAVNAVYILSFEKAEEYITSAISNFKLTGNESNQILAEENQFKIEFYNARFKEAERVLDKVISRSDQESDSYNYNRRLYFKACLLFHMGDFADANKVLDSLDEIDNDKEGWNIWVRIMRVLTLIERNKLDLAENEINNLADFINKVENAPLSSVRRREQLVLSALQRLKRNDFNFSATYEDRPVIMTQLDYSEKDYAWEVHTPELVVFHKWFMAKVSGDKYEFSIPAPVAEKARQDREKEPNDILIFSLEETFRNTGKRESDYTRLSYKALMNM